MHPYRYSLPSHSHARSCDRKINEFVKRVRACKIHMLLVGHMRNKMPSMFGAGKAQAKLLEGLLDVFSLVGCGGRKATSCIRLKQIISFLIWIFCIVCLTQSLGRVMIS